MSNRIDTHEFTLYGTLVRPGEHVLALIVIGPAIDEPGRNTLHLRIVKDALEAIQLLQSSEAKQELISGVSRMSEKFVELMESPR